MSETPLIKPLDKIYNIKKPNHATVIALSVILSVLAVLFIYLFFKDFRIIIEKIGEALYLTTSENRTALLECLQNNIGILIGPLLLWVVLMYAKTDPKAFLGNTLSYVLVMIVVVIGSFALFSSLLKFTKTPSMAFIIGFVVLLCIPIIKYFSSYISLRTIRMFGSFLKIVAVLIIIIGLAIGYKIFAERIKTMTGWSGFLANLLFYIPCMVTDGIEYLFYQFNITPNIVFVLFVLELLLILGYIYIPKIIVKSTKKSTITLQNKPVYLNKEIQVGYTQQFLFKPLSNTMMLDEPPDILKYRTNYCISMWVFLNIQASSSAAYVNDTNIFDYGSHPRITYKNSSDNKRKKNSDVYTFYFSNTSNDANYEVSIPNQKWNFIALNYFDSKVDLYINGNLERTFHFSNNMPEYSSTDLVKLGSDNGLEGAICNIKYNKKPLTTEQIAMIYNLNYLKNPPVDFIE